MNPTTIHLKSGFQFDFANPSPIPLEDIAWHLARIKRFSGMGVSVAEHSLLGWDLLRKSKARLRQTVAPYFLLHDALEAALGDDPSPKKVAVPELKELADEVLRVQWRHYLGDPEPCQVMEVKRLDEELLVQEAHRFSSWKPKEEARGLVEFHNWTPYAAEELMLVAFNLEELR